MYEAMLSDFPFDFPLFEAKKRQEKYENNKTTNTVKN